MKVPPRKVSARKKRRKKSAAEDFMRALHNIYDACKKESERGNFIRILYAGAFGIYRVDALSAIGRESLELGVFLSDEGEEMATIVVPISQCSIQFLEVARTPKTETRERPFIGFTVDKKTAPVAP